MTFELHSRQLQNECSPGIAAAVTVEGGAGPELAKDSNEKVAGRGSG